MKNLIIAILLLFNLYSAKAQIQEYYVNYEETRSYNNTLNAYDDFYGEDIEQVETNYAYMSYIVKVSRNTLIYEKYIWDKTEMHYSANTYTYIFDFVDDVKNSKYLFDKNCSYRYEARDKDNKITLALRYKSNIFN